MYAKKADHIHRGGRERGRVKGWEKRRGREERVRQYRDVNAFQIGNLCWGTHYLDFVRESEGFRGSSEKSWKTKAKIYSGMKKGSTEWRVHRSIAHAVDKKPRVRHVTLLTRLKQTGQLPF